MLLIKVVSSLLLTIRLSYYAALKDLKSISAGEEVSVKAREW